MLGLLEFNRLLEQLSKLSTQRRSIRRDLSMFGAQDIKQSLVKYDSDHKGYFTTNDLSKIIGIANKEINDYLQAMFPFEKIAYPIVIAYFVRDNTQGTCCIHNRPHMELTTKMADIIVKQCELDRIRRQLLSQINRFVPTVQTNTSLQDLKTYSENQSLVIDAEDTIMTLNSNANGKYLEVIFPVIAQQPLSKEDDWNHYQTARITSITERLQQRVANFGKEWLTQTRK